MKAKGCMNFRSPKTAQIQALITLANLRKPSSVTVWLQNYNCLKSLSFVKHSQQQGKTHDTFVIGGSIILRKGKCNFFLKKFTPLCAVLVEEPLCFHRFWRFSWIQISSTYYFFSVLCIPILFEKQSSIFLVVDMFNTYVL